MLFDGWQIQILQDISCFRKKSLDNVQQFLIIRYKNFFEGLMPNVYCVLLTLGFSRVLQIVIT